MNINRGTLLAATAAAGIALACASASFAENSVGLADATEDSGAAPDVSTVAVSNDDSGMVTFKIGVANRTALSPTEFVSVLIDADQKEQTGADGADYVLLATAYGTQLIRWNETTSKLEPAAAASLRSDWQNGPTISIDRQDLGGTTKFYFGVLSSDTAADDQLDAAPERGVWEYEVRLQLRLIAQNPASAFSGANARAGRPYSLGLKTVRTDTGETLHSGTITCSATLGKTRLASVRRSFVESSVGGSDDTAAVCTWKLPRNAKGKSLKTSVTVSFNGKSVSRSRTLKVR